ncbi:GspH/FimT family pseudopilin [Paucibacter sp. B2R-40]|uniref:GspH/FimT family pseudopilin n=1 Tax=Paucibacter sp. B2R-40 TaxID=2893554 RepID=UPI0021E43EA9|nr:GspH/FimT family pseudopilin [Paucibacter sp. B2R-40]MCV2356196.1 GspH/FimT family pseudopilin [Paucibacter sp. B2R-40]
MNTLRRRSGAPLHAFDQGFSLIELVVVIAILGFAMAAVLPEVGSWMRSLAVRNSAESLRSGIERARMEALRRNTNVSFWLVSESAKTLSNSCVLSNSGPSWVVSGADPAGKCGSEPSRTEDPMLIEKWSAADGSSGAILTSVDSDGTSAGSVTFNSLGQVLSTGTQIARIDVEHSASGVRTLRVEIEPGGAVRVCDPAVDASDPRHCRENGA